MKASVIGLGRVGFEFEFEKNRIPPASHWGCYCSLTEKVAEIAVCDVDESKLAKLHNSWGKFTDYHDMLTKFEPNVVSICTPTPTHTEIACAVAECPSVKAILLEKPVAQSLQEADTIIDTCKKNNVLLTVNYTRRWAKLYANIRDSISDKQPTLMVGSHPGPLLRTGTHMIDLFNWMTEYHLFRGNNDFDNEVSVQAFGNPVMADYMKGKGDDFNISGCVNYGDEGVQAILLAKPTPYLLFELDILCKTERIRVTDNGDRFDLYHSRKSKRYAGIRELEHTQMRRNTGDYESLLLRAVRETVERAEHKLKGELAPHSSCSGMDARRALQIALALHKSACETCGRVYLKDIPKDYIVVSH